MVKDFEIRYLSDKGYEPEGGFLKDRIVLRLTGEKFLKSCNMSCPHRKFLDLFIIYYYVVSLTDEMEECFLITDDIANYFDLREDELYKLAVENTFHLFPLKVRPLRDEINEMIGEETCHNGDVSEQVYICGNTVNAFGASAVIYTDMLENIAEKFNSDLFLLPSSVHEFLILPVNIGFKPDELLEMVVSVNDTVVADDEKLSDNVYVYRKGKLKIEMVPT